MAQKLTAAIPEGMDIDGGWTLQLAAVDPSTGAAVSGVTVSGIVLLVSQITPGGPEALKVAPLWIPIQETLPTQEEG